MWAWIVKFIGGLLPIGVKKPGDFWGKWFWGFILGCIAFVFMTNVVEHFFPSKPTVINVEGNYNQEPQDVAHFGCSMWRGYIRLGIKK